MGTQERLGVNIHVDQLMDGIANNCLDLERLELRWDPENLRFSDKSQKAIDILRVKCIKLRCLSLRYKINKCGHKVHEMHVNVHSLFSAMGDTTRSSKPISSGLTD